VVGCNWHAHPGAIWHALSIAGPNDIVLLAGKGHESTLATAAGPIPWDEAAIARRALADLGWPRQLSGSP
jgi:UDP-N-acetylmuramoyl-L-alanyl-D-glutamate--2,6-diaminopimelate ligase